MNQLPHDETPVKPETQQNDPTFPSRIPVYSYAPHKFVNRIGLLLPILIAIAMVGVVWIGSVVQQGFVKQMADCAPRSSKSY